MENAPKKLENTDAKTEILITSILAFPHNALISLFLTLVKAFTALCIPTDGMQIKVHLFVSVHDFICLDKELYVLSMEISTQGATKL